jgi:hypothetical protein
MGPPDLTVASIWVKTVMMFLAGLRFMTGKTLKLVVADELKIRARMQRADTDLIFF